jgi:hypothetical protein
MAGAIGTLVLWSHRSWKFEALRVSDAGRRSNTTASSSRMRSPSPRADLVKMRSKLASFARAMPAIIRSTTDANKQTIAAPMTEPTRFQGTLAGKGKNGEATLNGGLVYGRRYHKRNQPLTNPKDMVNPCGSESADP